MALLAGSLIVAVIIGIMGHFFGQSINSNVKHPLLSSVIDVVIGIVFIFFGIKTLLLKDRKFKEVEDVSLFKWVIIGFILSITNFDALLFSFTAIKEVMITQIPEIIKIMFLFANCLFLTMPILLPLFLYIAMPKTALKICRKINIYAVKYGVYIVFVLFMVFGIIFLKRALAFFV